MIVLKLAICIICAVLWRMGGAAGYDKLWRRLGSAFCMLGLLWLSGANLLSVRGTLSLGLLIWGCNSYFGWLNYIVAWWKKLEMGREYWWNFTLENICIQSSVLLYKSRPINVAFAIVWGLVVALVKVWIDSPYDLFEESEMDQAVQSELWHGGANALGILINSAI